MMQLRYAMPADVGMSAPRIERIKSLARQWVAEGITPALVVLAARHGVIVLHDAFGRQGPETDAPQLERGAVFPVFSITKPITATAVMCLVEDGVLGLQRPVQEYIPEFSGAGKEAVMVHHLLTHTSGLMGESLARYFAAKTGTPDIGILKMYERIDIRDYLRVCYDAPLSLAPGVEMSYCDYGIELLAEIIRRLTGKTLSAFVRERIFDPLGMHDSAIGLPERLTAKLVRRNADAPSATLIPIFAGQEWGAASAFMTASDLATFAQMYLNRGQYGDTRVLSPAAIAEMTRNQTAGIPSIYNGERFSESTWGYGWDVHGDKRPLRESSLFSAGAYSHGGSAASLLWIDPAYDLLTVYLSVQIHTGERIGSPLWHGDLFNNAVVAAVEDL